MTDWLFDPPVTRGIPVQGEGAMYPVNRIFCVGRNYAAHAAEMGSEVDREAPFYFTKSAEAVLLSGNAMAYPPGTQNFHHEMELVVALGAPVFKADLEQAASAVYAYGCGLDMTRRDLQNDAKEKRRSWDLGKDFEQAAVLSPLTKAADFGDIKDQSICLKLNGEIRQQAVLSDMVWSVPEIISHLSHFYHLKPGDVIMTGTPEGVGAVKAGDQLNGGIEGLAPITLTIDQPE